MAKNSKSNATQKAQNKASNDIFAKLQATHAKLAKQPKQRKSNGNASKVAKYAKQNVAIITAKIYRNSAKQPVLRYDMQLAHNASKDILQAIFGNKATDVAKAHKEYNARDAKAKQSNQSGKSTLLQDDIASTLLQNAKELQKHNIVIATDIIATQKAKLQAIIAKQATQAKASKAKAKATKATAKAQ